MVAEIFRYDRSNIMLLLNDDDARALKDKQVEE